LLQQGALLGGVMGSITKMDPNSTNQLLNQPNTNPGTPWHETLKLQFLQDLLGCKQSD
jgi:hypothetical protein